MLITGDNRASRISTCIDAAHRFLLAQNTAIETVESQLCCIAENWTSICDEAELSTTERNFFWGRQFLNPYALTALPSTAEPLAALAADLRESVA